MVGLHLFRTPLARVLFSAILGLRFLTRLPLHICWLIRTTVLQCPDVIDNEARARPTG